MRLQLTVSLLLNLLVCSIAGIRYAGINDGGETGHDSARRIALIPFNNGVMITSGAWVPDGSSGE
jgi:hypothetical protein